MSNDMLCIDRLTKTYPGGKRAVDALSLRVRPGRFTASSATTARANRRRSARSAA